jgi:asparagine synthase (glutamine-hydrolysing)
MCGIVGIVSSRGINKTNLDVMNSTMFHRGPDGSGLHVEDGFGFGHRRLAIVDLSDAGHQPMRYLDRYVITYNGEIYNSPELRSDLENRGYEFFSNTDTEVIMAAYDCWGDACFNKFNGMWAFCIFDGIKNEFILSRDRFGIKPLYYWFDGESFVFASEIKALLAYRHFGEPRANLAYLETYLDSGPREQAKETAFQGIYRFDTSSYVVSAREELFSGKFTPRKFWEFRPNVENVKFSEQKLERYARRYRELLKDSVRLRLRADVKVGSALSGGIDSSSIVSLINELHQQSGLSAMQETFSSVYKQPGTASCDESEYIDELADYLNVHSNQIEPRSEDIPSEHERMIYHFEMPPIGTCMSGWHTFKLVEQSDVTVTLDGQGADEQLAGYDGYITNYMANARLFESIAELRKIKVPAIRRRAMKGILIKFASVCLGRELALRLLGRFIPRIHLQALPLNQKLALDMVENLITLIHYSDRVSMAHSVESRMPYMDYRLIEFLFSVPAAYKFHSGWSKYLSRIAMNGRLPQSILWREDKMGWPIPEEFWFEGVHKKWLEKTVLESAFLRSYFSSWLERFSQLSLRDKLKLLNIAVWSNVFCVG